MISLVKSISKHLDLLRSLGVGKNAELILLQPGKVQGYDKLLIVKKGWSLEDSDIGQFQMLVILEQDKCSREVLTDARLFAINGVIYHMDKTYILESPSANAFVKEWRFPVIPSGEVYP